jgi:hypothetical protein
MDAIPALQAAVFPPVPIRLVALLLLVTFECPFKQFVSLKSGTAAQVLELSQTYYEERNKIRI